MNPPSPPTASPKLYRIFGSSIIDQAMLSGANFAVGLILIRYTAEAQYGYYVLAFNAMILATTLQGTFVGTPLVIKLPSLTVEARRIWVGGLLRDQVRYGMAMSGITLLAILIAWNRHWMRDETLPVALAALALIVCALYREYLRSVLLMYRRAVAVLSADFAYCVALLAGAALATRYDHAATIALLTAGVAALFGSLFLRANLRPDVELKAPRGKLREIARMGAWAAGGAVTYWLFTQGYTFLAAATLDVASVAALAASRLLLMPINLLVAGVQKQLVPVASEWVHSHGARYTLRKLATFSLGLGILTLLYAAFVWLLRDWIFTDLMRKTFEHRDALLLLWSAVLMATVLRDPLTQLLVLRQRFRLLMSVTFISALIALVISYLGMVAWGTRGALVGMLAGETFNLLATVWLAQRESRADAVPRST